MTLDDIFQVVLPILGPESAQELEAKLGGLSLPADKDWQKMALALVSDAVEKHGPEGIALAVQAVQDMMAGQPPKIDWADLRLASDIVAHMQNAEADHKREFNDYMVKIGKVAGIILATLIKSLVSG